MSEAKIANREAKIAQLEARQEERRSNQAAEKNGADVKVLQKRSHSTTDKQIGRIVMNGSAEVLRSNPDIDAAYLGGGNRTDYHAVKYYRRRRRWLA